MNELVRFRIILLVVMGALLAIAGTLYFLPLVLWLSILAKIMAGALVLFALAVTALLTFTLFPASNDLWETGYFKYMRAFYGDAWGGRISPFQIDVCRAIKLSTPVAVLWLLFFGSMAALWYVDINALTSGLKSTGFPWDDRGSVLVVRNIIQYNFLAIACLVFEVMFFMLFPRLEEYENDFLNKTVVVGGVHVAVALVFLATVVPVMYYGWLIYLKTVGYGLAATVIAFLILAALYATIKIGVKGLRALRLTVPGQLLTSREGGFKDNVCPLITQKKKSNL